MKIVVSNGIVLLRQNVKRIMYEHGTVGILLQFTRIRVQ